MARWLVGRLAGGFLTQFSGVSVGGGIYIGGVRSDRIGSEGQSAITALSSVTQTLLLENSIPSKSTAQCNKCIAKQIWISLDFIVITQTAKKIVKSREPDSQIDSQSYRTEQAIIK